MTKVSLLTKPILKGKESLYLDIYPPVFNPVSGKKSRREFLSLYTYSNPETPEQKSHNKNTLLNANEILRTKKKLLKKGEYEFTSQQVSVSFNEVEKMNRSKDFLIDLLKQVRNLEKQILEYLK
jgi:hypothetical protein